MKQISGTMLVTAVACLGLTLVAAGQRVDLSGTWVLEAATTSVARSTVPGKETKGPVRTSSNTASGAAFNCGRECTIVENGETLKIERAMLGSNMTPSPTVVLKLDGLRVSVIDSFNPEGSISAAGKWNGKRLEVTSADGSYVLTQLISLEAGRLVVVTSKNREGAPTVTFRYKRK